MQFPLRYLVNDCLSHFPNILEMLEPVLIVIFVYSAIESVRLFA